MRRFPSCLLLIGTLGACGLEMAKPVDGGDSGRDAERDTDADGGAGGGTDTDTDTDTDTSAADEICGNGHDDDGDGHADCADDACMEEPGCVCIEAIATGHAGAIASGDTTGSTDDRARGADAGCGSTASSAPDHAIAWTAPDAGCYAADTFGSSFDTVLRVVEGCDGEELACDDDSRDSSGAYTSQSQLLVGGSSGRAYTFVVDGFGGDD
ncbi:MAG: hypothetical protein VX000_18625, partial [Myxococcota bacterium]|nr:hypothetical protein [Myxococcota bacterium]